MGNRYTVVQSNITPTAGSDIITIVSPANRRARVVEVSVAGRGTTSAAQQVELARSTIGTSGGGALTPSKFEHSDQPAAASVVNTTWSVQPTIETHRIVMGFNALGGAFRWTAPQGKNAIEARNGENISLRASSGVTFQAISVSVVFEED